MADTTILTKAEYKALVGQPTGTERDTELQLAINAAASWFRDVFDWEIEQATRTIYLDGNDAIGPRCNVLAVPARYAPAIHSGGDLLVVTENGETLSVAVGYSANTDVILVGANTEQRLELTRDSAPWTSGYQNISVAGKFGYATANIPHAVKQYVAEVAMLMFRAPQWIGKGSHGTRGGSASFDRELSPHLKAALERRQQEVA